MPRRCLLSAALAALGWSLAAGVAVDGKHRQGQASLVAADPPAAAGAAAGAGAAPNMADVLDSAPALVYNDTVQSGEVARQALEDSEKEFAKINRLLDKQISEQGVKVMATKMHLQQAVACVEESTAHIADIKHREAAARAELAKLHAEAGIGAAAPPPPATSTAAPSNKTAASTTAAATVAAPAVGGGAKPAGAVSPAGAALLAMAKPGSSVAFVEVREQESAWAAQRSLRGGSGSGSGSGSGAGSNEAAARTHASEVVSSLETAWRRQATEEQGRPVVVLSNRAGGRGGAAAFVGHGRVVGGGKGAAAGTPDGGSIGGYSRLENVRAFLTSAAANAANSRLSLPSIGGLSPFLMMGDGGGGGGDGGGGRVGGRGGAGSGGDMGGAIAGIGGGGFPAAGGSGGGVVGGMGDPTSALKEALAKAVARVETWLSAVTAQSQATRNRRDECTVHVDELTSLLQSQRTFLALLRTRKEYEGKVFQAQQANDRSLAEFAEQEQGVLLADLVRFNRKWNVQRTATPELQLPPLSLPDWEEYSNTVALAAEPAAGAGGAGGAGAAAAAASAGRGTAVSVAVALGRGPPLPGRKGPRTADPELEVANTTAAATTAAPTEAAPATTNPAESTPAPPATTTRAPAAPTTAADAPTPPVVTTSGAPAESTAVLDDTTSAEPKLEPVAVADKPLVSNDAPPPSSNGTRPTLVISGQVKAWADINQTAEGSAEYSAFDISNNVFGAN